MNDHPSDAADNGGPRGEGDTGARPPGARRIRASALVAGAILGVGLTIAAAVAWLLLTRDTTPALTRARLESAISLWESRDVPAYEIEVVVSGRASGTYRAVVRNGQPVSASRNGRDLRRRTWDSWTVEGLFGFLQEELDNAADPTSYNAPPGTQVVLRADFDQRYGYPSTFERVVLEESLDIDVVWQVTRFEVIGPRSDPQDP